MPEIIHLPQTHSTNKYLRNLIESNVLQEEGTVVWADYQLAGRGQQGNSWESEEDKNLLFSLMLSPKMIPAKYQFIISQIVSLGILDVLNGIKPGFRVKWPNDIYFGDKKVAGILIENDLSGHSLYNSIIGIGLNVNQELFLSDAPNPVSLKQIAEQEFNRQQLLLQIVERIFHYYDIAIEENWEMIQDRYMDFLYRKEGYHTFEDDEKQFKARIHEIDTMGMLTLEDKEGIKRSFAFKEVQFVM